MVLSNIYFSMKDYGSVILCNMYYSMKDLFDPKTLVFSSEGPFFHY